MSITDELRAWAKEHLSRSSILAIADRIDTAHEEALVSSYFDGVFSDEELAENGFMRLPKDADGEFIRIGDTMEWMTHDKTYQPVIRIVSGVGADVFFAWSGKSCQYAQYDAQVFRHYKQPTIEEVLTEFGIDWEHEDNCEDRAALLAEYAKRLKLAGEGE